MANGLLAFGTGLMIVAAAISAVLATYFIRKSSYKNAEAAGIFGGIFAFAALIFFIYLQVTESAEINNLRQAIAAGASGAKTGFIGGVQQYGYLQPKTAAAPVVAAAPAAPGGNPMLNPEGAFAQPVVAPVVAPVGGYFD